MIRVEPVRSKHASATRLPPWPAAMVLALLAMMTAHAEGATPRRDLTAEAAELGLGTAAYVHTDYSAGAGMLLPGGNEVLVARHVVLAPDGKVAERIGVGLPRLPLNNIVEVPTRVEAQDPSLDLVLLRVAGAADLGVTSQASTAQPCAIVAVAAALPAHHRPLKGRHTSTRRTEAQTSRPTRPVQTPASEARLRIVVDGPRTR